MPDVTVPLGKVGSGLVTLAPSTVSTVTFAENIAVVEVIWDGTADVWYTVDGSTPTIAGTNCYRLPAGVAGSDVRPTINTQAGTDVVKLISSATPVVSVQRA